MSPPSSPLPYQDAKPQGAADFYFAINATFRFIQQRFGIEGLRRYWSDLGQRYFAPVSERWKRGGLQAVVDYWRAFFAAEPGSEVEVNANIDGVTLNVRVCPAIAHLRKAGREIVPCFCQHCYFISEAIAAPAGLTVRIEGGNGSCKQVFLRRSSASAPQDLARIVAASLRDATMDNQPASRSDAIGTGGHVAERASVQSPPAERWRVQLQVSRPDQHQQSQSSRSHAATSEAPC